MTTRIWIKLYLEILDDPKMGCLTDTLWRRLVELFLIAGRNGSDGALPPLQALAWSLRLSQDRLLEELHSLAEIGVVHEAQPGAWVVTNFAKRQASISDAERSHMYRERKKENGVTNRDDIRHGAGVASSTSTSTSTSTSDSISDSVSDSDSTSATTSVSDSVAEDSLRIPQTPAEALSHPDVRVFLAATDGHMPGMHQYRTVVETVRLLRTGKRLDDVGLAAYLEPFWRAWTGSLRRDGRPYDRSNLSWLTEWALNGTLPQPAPTTDEVIRAVVRRMR